MASAASVRTELQKLLPTLDMDNATERQIRATLAERLEAPMEPHRQLIKEEIDSFLTASLQQQQGPGAAAAAAGAAKKARAAPAAAARRPAAKGRANVKDFIVDDDEDVEYEDDDEYTGGGGSSGSDDEDDDQGLGTEYDDEFIDDEDDDFLEGGRGGGERKPAAAAAAAAGGKRKRAAAGAGAGRAPKAAKAAPAAAAAAAGGGGASLEGGIKLDAAGLKWATVSTYKGQQRVDVRNYYKRKDDGQLAPTQKGASFSLSQWAVVQGVLLQLAAAVEAGDEAFDQEIGSGWHATCSMFNGQLQVGLREYYTDKASGELKPGKRGINLLPDQLQALLAAFDAINSQLPAGGAAAPSKPAPSKPAAPAAAAGAPAGADEGPAAAAGAGAAAAGGPSVAIDLGARKRAAISTFTGSACVDLRECYEKDGQLAPTKKGIMLKPGEWDALVAAAPDISDALGRGDDTYRLSLGNKRDVTISEFKKVTYVGVRQYYGSDDDLKPTQKGLNMNAAQWGALVAGMPALSEGLQQQQS